MLKINYFAFAIGAALLSAQALATEMILTSEVPLSHWKSK